MNRRSVLSDLLQANRIAEGEEIGSAAHERAMMLELASTLEQWPTRNADYGKALEQVAQDVIRLAGAIPAE